MRKKQGRGEDCEEPCGMERSPCQKRHSGPCERGRGNRGELEQEVRPKREEERGVEGQGDTRRRLDADSV